MMLDLLGIDWARGDKDKDFAPSFSPLGVVFDLSQLHTRAEVSISNKPSRIDGIEEILSAAVSANRFTPAVASEVHGKMHFSQAQVFGRSALPAIREIGNRAHDPGKSYAVTQRLKTAFDYVIHCFRSMPPRKITACDCLPLLHVFSDGAFEDGVATWGFVIVDCSSDSRTISGGTVPHALTEAWLAVVGKQVITQVEMLAVLFARLYLGKACAGRKMVYWIDNDPARDAYIRGHSDSDASLSILYSFFGVESQAPNFLWFSRVPSYSNVADEPSRGKAVTAALALKAVLVQFELPASVLGSLTSCNLAHD